MKKRRMLGVLAALFMILGLGAVASAATTGPDIGGRSQWFIGQTINFGSSEVKYQSYSLTDIKQDRGTSIKMFEVGGSRKLQASEAYQGKVEYKGNAYRLFYFHEIDGNGGQGLVILQDSSKADKTPTGIRVVEGDGSPSAPYMFECIYDAPPAHVHSFSPDWTKDGACHWHACTAEGAGDACLSDPGAKKAEHSYGTSGDARFTCAVCKYVDLTKKAKAEEADTAAKEAEEKAAAEKAEAEKAETEPSNGTPAPKTADEQPQTQQEKITIAKAPVLKKLKAKKNKVQVTWKKIRKNKAGKKLIKQIKYIEVQAARDPNFKNIVTTKNVGKKKSKTVLKLARKTTYYVRVRYVGGDGVSKWSKTKKIKTK